MDFRVKKLILEEGMKNIAETEGVKLEMECDGISRRTSIRFTDKSGEYLFAAVVDDCDYNNPNRDVFKAINNIRKVVVDARARKAGFEEYRQNVLRQTAKTIALLQGSHFGKFPTLLPKIKNVIFNYPATIVFWADGDKTVVKCQNDDVFDAEKGLAMAIVKKAYGGKGNYCEIFKPWIEKYMKVRYAEFEAEIKKAAERFYNVACETSADDIQDILEGKVDPLMIKTDEEDETEENTGTMGLCKECKHYDLDGREEPCVNCRSICAEYKHSYWEPKE